MKRFGFKRFVSLLVAGCMFLTSNAFFTLLDITTVYGATSFLGSDDELAVYNDYEELYGNTFKEIHDLEELRYYVYAPEKGINHFDLPAHSECYTGRGYGEAHAESDKIVITMENHGDENAQDGLRFYTNNEPLSKYDLLYWNYTRVSGPSGSALGGYFDLQIYHNDPSFYQGSLLPEHVGTRGVSNGVKFLDNQADNVLEGSLYHAYDEGNEGKTYRNDLYSVTLEKGGTIVSIDPNGGIYEGSSSKKLFFSQQAHDATGFHEYHKLETEIPVLNGFTFVGWEIVNTDYVKYGSPEADAKIGFSADGMTLLVDTERTAGFRRLSIELRAKWASNGNSTLTVNTDNGSSNYDGLYLDKLEIPIPSDIDGHIVKYDGNSINNDTVILDKNSEVTRMTFANWKQSNPIYGYLDAKGVYTFLGYNNASSSLTAVYSDLPINGLPSAKSKAQKYAFLGWYTEKVPLLTSLQDLEKYSSSYVGSSGAKPIITEDTTLYAGWGKVSLTMSLTGYSKNGELDLLSWGMLSKSSNVKYRVYHSLDNQNWEIKSAYGTTLSQVQKNVYYTNAGTTYIFTAPSAGTYEIYCVGGKGGNTSSGTKGGYGGYIKGKIYLKPGDVLKMIVGGNGSQTNSGRANGGANGGGYGTSYIDKCTNYGYNGNYIGRCTSAGFNYWNDGSGRYYTGSYRECGNSNHFTLNGVDVWRCGNCSAFTNAQDFEVGGGWGTGGCSGCWSPWYNRATSHKNKNYGSGGGGGFSAFYLNDVLIAAAGGGAGATASASGLTPSGTYSSVNDWLNNQNGVNGTTNGAAGGGAGRGKNYYNPSVFTGSVTCGSYDHVPCVSISYSDWDTSETSMIVESVDTASALCVSDANISGVDENDSNIVSISFNAPEDMGSKYYYSVEMYDVSTNDVLTRSSSLEKIACVGLDGYYYKVDNTFLDNCDSSYYIKDGKLVYDKDGNTVLADQTLLSKYKYVTGSNGAYVKASGEKTDTIENISRNKGKYLHVASVDRAGNVGLTYTYEIPAGYFIKFNGNYPTSGTMKDLLCLIGLSYNLPKNEYEKKGFDWTGWNTSQDGSGTSYEDEDLVKNLAQPGAIYNLYAQWTPIKYKIIYDKNSEYATFVGDSPISMQHKITDGFTTTTYVDCDINKKYCIRPGWDFVGWGLKKDVNRFEDAYNGSDKVEGTNRLPLGYEDITLYGVYTRNLRLILAEDTHAHLPQYEFRRQIWTQDSAFVFNDSSFIDTTRRDDNNNVQYIVKFAHNGNSTISDSNNGVGTEDASAFMANPENIVVNNNDVTIAGNIIVSPGFDGWYTEDKTLLNYEDTTNKVGESGTSINVTPSSTKGNVYDVTGDYGTVTVESNNKEIKLYPEWFPGHIILPNATRNEDNDGENGAAPDLFVGWFTEPQIDNNTEDGGEYIGKPGDVVIIDNDVILYPWFNKAPTIVRSEIATNGNSGLFWEGQPISYEQLLTLINCDDKDNYVDLTKSNSEIQWNGFNAWNDAISSWNDGHKAWGSNPENNANAWSNGSDSHGNNGNWNNEVMSNIDWKIFSKTSAWKALYSLNVDVCLHDYVYNNSDFDGYTDFEKNDIIKSTKERLLNYSNQYDTDGVDDGVDFHPFITGISYYCDGIDSNGFATASNPSVTNLNSSGNYLHSHTENYYSGNSSSSSGYQVEYDDMYDVVNGGLQTDTPFVGKIVIHYAIADNGTFDFYNDKYISTVNGYKMDSNIIVKFDLVTEINFNNRPKFDVNYLYIYSTDPFFTKDNIYDYVVDSQRISDVEDDTSNMPWWNKDVTHPALVESKEIVNIENIQFQPGFYQECPDVCERIKDITNIEELFALKESSDDLERRAFEYITNFDVIIDAHDQWNKYASDERCGQSKKERTVTVIMYNCRDDFDIQYGSVAERIRYIDSGFESTLGNTSYWYRNDYGAPLLNNTFRKYYEKKNLIPITYNGVLVNSTPDNNERKINVVINDYS